MAELRSVEITEVGSFTETPHTYKNLSTTDGKGSFSYRSHTAWTVPSRSHGSR